ncbi:mitochondrial processing peptidase [Cantharellus anzutake]|uniref:mitochondrial processing peptidase n=1 Tax=Cantharellus anzutake TaxID=1750568 RepID=UPI00190867A5|nr:mitochondrial processing peptidase [Cantharellus anzutake]KAF8333158.1 mitochondrial processing peptidase [Cantharellus anzutake]
MTVLPNKLRVVTENSYGHFSSLGVYIDAGSRYESARMSGVSHMLDRMAFKSTESCSAAEMSSAVDSLGGQIVCSSSRESMMYQSSHFNSATPLAMSLMADTVRRPLYLSEEVNMQRDAAAYEIREINTKPEMILPEILHQVAYQSNTIGNPLLCPEDRLAHIDGNLLREFSQTWFRPDRIVIAGAGLSHEELVELADKHFGDLKAPPALEPSQAAKNVLPHLLSPTHIPSPSLYKSLTTAATAFLSPKPIAEPSFSTLASAKARYTGGHLFLHRPDEEFNHVYIAFEGFPINNDDIYTLATIQMLLGGGGSFSAGGPGKGMYSRLYTHVLNHHAQIDHCSAFHHIYSDTSLFGIVGTSYPSMGPDGLVPIMIHQLALLAHGDIPAPELSRAKNQLMSSLVMALESRAVEVEDLGRQVLVHGRKISVQEMCAKVEKVSAADVRRVADEVFGTAARTQPTVLIMGREDAPDWKRSFRQYGVGRDE